MTRLVAYSCTYLVMFVCVADSALTRLSITDVSARLYDAWGDASSSDELMSIADKFLNDGSIVQVLERALHSFVNVTDVEGSAKIPFQKFSDVLVTDSVALETLRHVEQVLLSSEMHDKILGNQSSRRLEHVLHRLSGEIEPVHGMIASLLQRGLAMPDDKGVLVMPNFKVVVFSPRVVFKIKNIANAPVWLLLRFTYLPVVGDKKFEVPEFQARYAVGSVSTGADQKHADWNADCENLRQCFRYVFLDRKYTRSPNMYDQSSVQQDVGPSAPDGDCLTGGPQCYYALNHMPVFRSLGVGILQTTINFTGSKMPEEYDITAADDQIVIQLFAVSQFHVLPKPEVPFSAAVEIALGRVISLATSSDTRAGLGVTAVVGRLTMKHHLFLSWSWFIGFGIMGLELQYNFPKMHRVDSNQAAGATSEHQFVELVNKIKVGVNNISSDMMKASHTNDGLNTIIKGFITKDIKCVDPIKPGGSTASCPRLCVFCYGSQAHRHDIPLMVNDITFHRDPQKVDPNKCIVADALQYGGDNKPEGGNWRFTPHLPTSITKLIEDKDWGTIEPERFANLVPTTDIANMEREHGGGKWKIECSCHHIVDDSQKCADPASLQHYYLDHFPDHDSIREGMVDNHKKEVSEVCKDFSCQQCLLSEKSVSKENEERCVTKSATECMGISGAMWCETKEGNKMGMYGPENQGANKMGMYGPEFGANKMGMYGPENQVAKSAENEN